MNRIITILVTIFILLLLYIWISHVWGSDNPRHANEIVDGRQTEVSDGLMADADTTYHSTDITEPPAEQNPSGTNEFDTDRKAEGVTSSDSKTEEQTPAAEEKQVEKPAVKVVEEPKKLATPVTKTETKTETKTVPSKPASTGTVAKPAVTPAKPVAKSTTNTEGKHLVIAGNFTQQINAQQRVDELKRAGYKDAEVVNFDLSEYHTVCVGRFSDVNEARKLVRKLKDYQKIDAYVRIGG